MCTETTAAPREFKTTEEVRLELDQVRMRIRCVRSSMEYEPDQPRFRWKVRAYQEWLSQARAKLDRARTRLLRAEELVQEIAERVHEIDYSLRVCGHEKQIKQLAFLASKLRSSMTQQMHVRLLELTATTRKASDLKMLRRALLQEAQSLMEVMEDPAKLEAEVARQEACIARHREQMVDFLVERLHGDEILDALYPRAATLEGLLRTMRESRTVQRMASVEREMAELTRGMSAADLALVEQIRATMQR